MKKGILSLALAMIFGVAATATEPIDGEKKTVNVEKSKVTWKAYKVAGGHEGTVNLKSGHLMFDGNKLTGGEFVVDMPTLVSTDLEGDMKGKLEGHLKSDDFFSVENHKTSKLVITSVKPFNDRSSTVTGNLTIKGITKPITFVISLFDNKATATLKVDRTEYDIKFRSGSFFENLGDKTIYDEFDLVVDLAY
ncbi:YceI family protein [Maribacter algicola]|uniref:YceI family protein n=1 Tax=Meishania litoralis TaxID=3434685 RepID=A0ACC7LNH3_9FLAO